jgi:hypothetical protein
MAASLWFVRNLCTVHLTEMQFWDWAMGTDKAFKDFEAKRKAAENNTQKKNE